MELPEEERELLNHAVQIGQLMMAWNDAQHLVLSIFRQCMGVRLDLSDAVFFALKADVAQREIAVAAAEVALAQWPTTLGRARSAVQQLNHLSGSRNAATHTMWWLEENQVTPIHDVYTWLARKELKEDWQAQFEKLLDDLIKVANNLRQVSTEIHGLIPLPSTALPPSARSPTPQGRMPTLGQTGNRAQPPSPPDPPNPDEG